MSSSSEENWKVSKETTQTKKPNAEMKFDKHIVHSYSTYSLSNEQYILLSYGLDIHILSKANTNMIYTEFEVFYQGLLKDIGKTPKTELQLIKPNYEIRGRSTRK